jgi:hypothetical protein
MYSLKTFPKKKREVLSHGETRRQLLPKAYFLLIAQNVGDRWTR